MHLTAAQYEAQMPDAGRLMSDEPEMESSLHYTQLLILVTCLEWLWRDREDFFIGANLTVYFSRQELKNRDFRGPDFFLVQQTEKRPRPSWVVWEEDGRYPDLIIELLSDSTAQVDRTLKKTLYQNRFHTPEYFWFSPETQEFMGFRLAASGYQEILPNALGHRWSQELGFYLGVDERGQLRYFNTTGAKLPTPDEANLVEIQRAERATILAEQAARQSEQALRQAELASQRADQASQQAEQAAEVAVRESQRAEAEHLRAEAERQRADQETQRAETERQRADEESQRAELLAARLKALGIDPENLSDSEQV
jgi:Uma2 family endonuclease